MTSTNNLGLFATSPDYHRNRIVNSRLQFFERQEQSTSHLSIKYVVSGTERYTLKNHTFCVHDQHFLVTNKGSRIETSLSAPKTVVGVCFFLDQKFLEDVRRNMVEKATTLLDNPLFESSGDEIEFFEECYHARENDLGQYVHTLASNVTSNGLAPQIDPSIYYGLSERLLGLHHKTTSALNRLESLKVSTRHELLRRIRMATRILDDNCMTSLNMGDVASEASLSPFHFFRTFKKIHGVSPYQYLLDKKLSRAATLLETFQLSITEVAHQTGFPDIHSFSKSFKKKFGKAPSAFVRAGETKQNTMPF